MLLGALQASQTFLDAEVARNNGGPPGPGGGSGAGPPPSAQVASGPGPLPGLGRVRASKKVSTVTTAPDERFMVRVGDTVAIICSEGRKKIPYLGKIHGFVDIDGGEAKELTFHRGGLDLKSSSTWRPSWHVLVQWYAPAQPSRVGTKTARSDDSSPAFNLAAEPDGQPCT